MMLLLLLLLLVLLLLLPVLLQVLLLQTVTRGALVRGSVTAATAAVAVIVGGGHRAALHNRGAGKGEQGVHAIAVSLPIGHLLGRDVVTIGKNKYQTCISLTSLHIYKNYTVSISSY